MEKVDPVEVSSVIRNTTVNFSGYIWDVRNGENSKSSPGPNYYTNRASNVWIDPNNGKLHMKVSQISGKWMCCEIDLSRSLGYGKYTWLVETDPAMIDTNLCLGLFYYKTDTQEIDIEMSKWRDASYPNTQFTVQPGIRGNSLAFNVLGGNTLCSFTWERSYVLFSATNTRTNQVWNYTKTRYIPPVVLDSTIAIDLWMCDGVAPLDVGKTEAVINSFTFQKM
jgi:hypothetical protein